MMTTKTASLLFKTVCTAFHFFMNFYILVCFFFYKLNTNMSLVSLIDD